MPKPNRPRGLESRDAQAKSKSDSDRGNRNEEGAHRERPTANCTDPVATPVQLLDEHPTRPASRAEDQGGKALETMARVRALVVDKTGTLTRPER